MKRTSIMALSHAVGQKVKIQGFVETIRDQKSILFIVLRDKTGIVQIVCDKNKFDILGDITPESALTIIGSVLLAPQVKAGGVEIQCEEITIESRAETPLPIAKDSSLDKKLDWRAVSLRSQENLLLFEVQTTMEKAMRDYWQEHGFIEIHSPKLMGTASESGAELFELKYFDTKAYLAQSPQFYKQMAMAAGFERIFEIGPVFRAERSLTTRHATEYTSIDMEMSWIDSYEDIMRFEEDWLHHAINAVKQAHGDAVKQHFGVDIVVPALPFPRITLEEGRKILAERGHVIAHKADLDPAGERLLGQYIKEKYGHEFVFVTDYPVDVRAFYHMRHTHDPSLTQSFDLLWKGLEITTGAQREHRLDRLTQQALEKGLSPEPLQHYLDFFKYGCPPHGGCGVGLERLLMVLLGCETIRDVTYLYRGPNRLTP
jgi:nondiscriminating aspartyl-tRNA synthetase